MYHSRKYYSDKKRGDIIKKTLFYFTYIALFTICIYLSVCNVNQKSKINYLINQNTKISRNHNEVKKAYFELKILLDKKHNEIERLNNLIIQHENKQILNSRNLSVTRNRLTNYLGEFIATAYCIENYHHICNDGNPKTTAIGTTPIPYKTIAVDTKIIPFGTKLKIEHPNGNIYYVTATDTGGAIKGNKIDMVCNTHQEALSWGKVKVKIWKVE